MSKVFIGMLAYNGEKHIDEAIQSLLQQSFSDITLFISDDASTDKTREICESYAKKDSRVVYYRQPKNIGMFPQYKFLLDKADGEYFMWASHDDIWEKDFIKTCINNMEKNTNIGFASACTSEIDSFGRTLREIPEFAKLAGKPGIITVTRYVLQPEILGKCNIMYSLFRTTAIQKVWTVYPQRKEWGSDYHFSLATISMFEGVIDKKVLFKKRRGGFSNPLSCKNETAEKMESCKIANPKNHMFPFGRFGQYFRGHMEALHETHYQPLVAILLLVRLPRSFIIYLKERNYKKFLRRCIGITLFV